MTIAVDADSIHSEIKRILFNFILSTVCDIYFVADRELKDVKEIKKNKKSNVYMILVESKENSADDWIVNNAQMWDLVITHDIPLCQRLLEKKDVYILDERGSIINCDNIGYLMSERNFMSVMRDNNIYEKKGVKHPITKQDIKKFADNLNSIKQKILKYKHS